MLTQVNCSKHSRSSQFGVWHGPSSLDTATWTCPCLETCTAASPNKRNLASTSLLGKPARLWNLKTNRPIETSLHHEQNVNSVTFSGDGEFLVTGCENHLLCTWDISSMPVKEAGLLSDSADSALQTDPKMKGARRRRQ
ncbi:hypothetical protein P692DRAFT_20499876 [Suillus brevipes Sb2]|nr:hypothetical protein P692DRAFT_20499876 [Suillus brevipes Sb2]